MPFFANRRTVLKGVLGAGVLAGVAAPDIASASSDECGVAHGWGKVADVFRANFEGNPGEVGAACSVYVGGRPVVNLWGGLADREANRPWRNNTIMQVASTTKGAGHPGSGGSIGFADPDPDAEVGFGYITNLWSFRPDDPRAANLAKAVRTCLG
jgi:hypothetical protein